MNTEINRLISFRFEGHSTVSSLVVCSITECLFQFHFNNSTKIAQGYPMKLSLKYFLIFKHSRLVMKSSMCYVTTDDINCRLFAVAYVKPTVNPPH